MTKNRKFKAVTDPLENKLLEANENYDSWMNFETGDTRTVDFQMLNGERENFSYNHYVKSSIQMDGNHSIITIYFSSDRVTIKGYCLLKLYNHLCKMNLQAVRAK